MRAMAPKGGNRQIESGTAKNGHLCMETVLKSLPKKRIAT